MDYYFRLRFNRWACGPVGEYLHHVLGAFAVPADPLEVRNPPTPGMPPVYSLLSRRSADAPFQVLLGDTPIYTAHEPCHAVAHLLWHVNAEAVRQTGSYLLIHAGAVCDAGGRGVVLPATSGSGKTTLTAALLKAGYSYLTDEAAAIDPVGGEVYGYPKALTMKDPAMIAALGCPDVRGEWAAFTAEARHVHPGELGATSRVRSASIDFVVAPRYKRGATTTLTPLTPAETAAELLGHAMNARRYGRRSLPLVAEVARKARGFRLVSGELGEAVDAVHDIVAGQH